MGQIYSYVHFTNFKGSGPRAYYR